ncbi:MAG TPA: dicarboxylate/amino acid:cation symporter [Ignavibacteriales bacterium]|nr:dicarboxylate/amino acid:cation symporter [Ignavibacteriales bacterium]
MNKIPLHYQILAAFVLALILGIAIPSSAPYFSWLGDLFLRALRMIIIPLILTSIAAGAANIGTGSDLGRIGGRTLVYYAATTLTAILTGLILVNIFRPGIGADLGLQESVTHIKAADKSIGDILLEIVPTNIFQSFAAGDMLPIIFFALLLGFFAIQLEGKQKETVVNIFASFFELMMKITDFIIKFAPLGVFGIVVKIIAEQSMRGTLIHTAGSLGTYMFVVAFGLAFHNFITLSGILYLGRINPLKHIKAMTVPMLTAFSTASSNATLPLTMEAVEKEEGVSNKISSFVLPLGATVNMNGTALYECVAVVFIAQAYGVELTLTQQAIVVLTSLLSAVGTAGIPMASLATISIILTAVGLPFEGMGLILTVDRILDMMRTTVNVYGDTCGAAIIAKMEGEKLNTAR